MAIRTVVTRGYGAGATIGLVVTRGYIAGEAIVPVVVAVTVGPGWKFLMEFDTFRTKRDEEEEKRKQAEELVKDIESPVDREIATLLQQDLATDTRKEEISELQQLIAKNATDRDFEAAKAHNARIAKVFVRAALNKNFSAVEALERELDREREEDEFLYLALILLQ